MTGLAQEDSRGIIRVEVSYTEAYAFYGWTCWVVSGVYVELEDIAQGQSEMPLEDFLKVPGVTFVADGAPVTPAVDLEIRAVLHELSSAGAIASLTPVPDSGLLEFVARPGGSVDLAESTLQSPIGCDYAWGSVRLSTTEVELGGPTAIIPADQGHWESYVVDGYWGKVGGAGVGTATFGILPFLSSDVGGGATFHWLPNLSYCYPPILDVSSDESGESEVGLYPWAFVYQYIQDARIPFVPLRLDANFCGWGLWWGDQPARDGLAALDAAFQ